MNRHHRRRFVRFFLAGAVAALSGCSAPPDNLPREAVSGTVTLDDQPLANGTIQFTPSETATGVGGGAAIQGGKFAIPRETGLVPGSYRVAIFSAGNGGEAARPQSPEGRGKARSSHASEAIPAKYNAQTELKADIKHGGTSGSLLFALKSK
jgi:hypothetical protein